jgi:hypothetical protein
MLAGVFLVVTNQILCAHASEIDGLFLNDLLTGLRFAQGRESNAF